MIQKVDEIQTETEKSKTKRQMIEDDLMYAYENGIDKFELVGYEGSMKLLAGYASEIARSIERKIYDADIKTMYGNDRKVWGLYRGVYRLHPLFRISRKAEGDTYRVFVKIIRGNRKECNEDIQRCEERRKEREKKKDENLREVRGE